MFRSVLEVPIKWLSRVVLAVSVSACGATPPAGWQTGGQHLVAPRARWVNGELLVDVEPDGRVFVDGRHFFTIDASGRVYDAYNQPVALLQPDGMVIGTNDTPMGWVGAGEAILPGGEHSWLVLMPGGLLLQSDGDAHKAFGQWLGCDHARVVQLCTLVSHVIGREMLARRGDGQGFGLSPGIGLGVGAGMLMP